MKPISLLYSLCYASLSYAYYQSATNDFNMTIGPDPTVFRIGRDIYTIALPYQSLNYRVSKFGISASSNQSLYALGYRTNFGTSCLFCSGHVLNETSVLITSGYNHTTTITTNQSNIGVTYYNINTNTYTVPFNNRAFPGNPSQRIMHQEVMTSDKGSIYFFGGILAESNLGASSNIFELNIQNSTFYNRGSFTSVGGTATMLPSGIVVLAFGTNKLKSSPYKTDAVYLFNTQTNKLSYQPVGGTTPQPRILATGTLGSDTFISVTLNDTLKIDRTQANVTPGLVVLNTSSWVWMYPNVSGPPSVDRFSAFSMMYEDGSIIIGGGSTSSYNFSDISVLRNLPLARESLDTTNIEWFTNSVYDTYYNSNGVKTDNKSPTDDSDNNNNNDNDRDDYDYEDDDDYDYYKKKSKLSVGWIVFLSIFGFCWLMVFLFIMSKVIC